MDNSRVITLIQQTYTKDSIGQFVPTEIEHDVYGDVMEGATRAEFSAAGERGLKPSCKVSMFKYDYHGEKIVEMSLYGETKRLTVYRTFTSNDRVELYLTESVGNDNH